ncbi:histidine kinase N-terminal domain-containing protein [bacterium]|nr:histidine kinase N-terminal domain-containing protein [bacterium]
MAINTIPPSANAPHLMDLVPNEGHRRWIAAMARQLPFLADMIPADLLIYVPTPEQRLVVVAEAKPTVRESFYARSLLGQVVEPDSAPPLFAALRSGAITEGATGKVINGQPMGQVIYPMGNGKEVCALLVVERNLYDQVKHTEEKRELYRTAISRTVQTLLSKSRTSELTLPSIQPGDALLLLNQGGQIVHASHSAANLARRMGLPELLEGLSWADTFLANREKRLVASNAIYEETELLTPQMAVSVRTLPLEPADEQVASILVLRDISEIKEKDRELAIKETIIREVHHRVKNNLQTVAALLRLQQRRSRNTEVKSILSDCIDRISSIALVHEYLSHEDVEMVDIKELAYNLLSASLQSMIPPEKQIDARVMAPSSSVTLSSAKATSVALIINELLQNTFKHAFTGRTQGRVELTVTLAEPDVLHIVLHDDGIGLPADFDPQKDANLGWEIIYTLAQQDLRGDIAIESSSQGTTVTVSIPVSERG